MYNGLNWHHKIVITATCVSGYKIFGFRFRRVVFNFKERLTQFNVMKYTLLSTYGSSAVGIKSLPAPNTAHVSSQIQRFPFQRDVKQIWTDSDRMWSQTRSALDVVSAEQRHKLHFCLAGAIKNTLEHSIFIRILQLVYTLAVYLFNYSYRTT